MSKRIAFCGTRGIPANYGGFETAVDEISKRFAMRGYECDVFCRSAGESNVLTEYGGRKLLYVKGSRIRKLDTFVSAFQTAWYLIKNRGVYDHVFWFNNANLPGILISLFIGLPITVNTDGLEWRRRKWSYPFKAYYFISSGIISMLCPRLVSDSIGIKSYYRRVFKKDTTFIPYGVPGKVEVSVEEQKRILSRYGLSPGKYILQITRIEPDNLPLEVVSGFIESGLGGNGYGMVVVGFKDETEYALKLKELGNSSGVQVLPAIYDPDILYTLRKNSFCYAHGNSVGGTNPALLEAMATCPRILAIDSPFSREVLGELGRYFDVDDIAASFRVIQDDCEITTLLQERVEGHYQWDAVASSYMDMVESGTSDYSSNLT